MYLRVKFSDFFHIYFSVNFSYIITLFNDEKICARMCVGILLNYVELFLKFLQKFLQIGQQTKNKYQ